MLPSRMAKAFHRFEEEGREFEPWRHVVLACSFGVQFLFTGLLKAYAVLLPFLVVQSQSSYAVLGFIVTSLLGLSFLCSPIANLLIKRFSSRVVAVVGSCVTSFALLASACTTSTWAFGVCLVISGCCFASSWQYMVVVLRQHYRQYFGFAHSIAYGGAVVGSLLMPVMTINLYLAYGLHGAMLSLGALSLNLIPLSMAMRPPRSVTMVTESESRQVEAGRLELDDAEDCHCTRRITRQPSAESSSGNTESACLHRSEEQMTKDREYTLGKMPRTDAPTTSNAFAEVPCLDAPSSLDSADTASATRFDKLDHLLMDSRKECSPKDGTDIHGCNFPSKDRGNKNIDHSAEEALNVVQEFQRICRAIFVVLLDTIAYHSIRKELAFSIIMGSCSALQDFCYAGWLVFMVSYAVSFGIHPSMAIYLPVAASLGGLAARISTGCLFLRRPHCSPAVNVAMSALATLGLFSYTFNSSLANLVTCSVITGIGMFGATSSFIPMTSEVVAEDTFKDLAAFTFFLSGVPILFSGFLTGMVYDLTGSFVITFWTLGSLMGSAVIISITFFIFRNKVAKNDGG